MSPPSYTSPLISGLPDITTTAPEPTRRRSIVKNKSFSAFSSSDKPNMGAVSQVTPSLLSNVLKDSSTALSVSTPSLVKSPYSSQTPSCDTTPAHTPPASPRTLRHFGLIVNKEENCSPVKFAKNPQSFILNQMKALHPNSDMSSSAVMGMNSSSHPTGATSSDNSMLFDKSKKIVVTKKYIPKKSAFRELEMFFPSSQ